MARAREWLRLEPGPTAEDAPPRLLRWATAELALWGLVLVLLGPAVRGLILVQTSRTAVLAWLLVALGLYWLYAGLGYRALLLAQLGSFSAAASLLSLGGALHLVGLPSLAVLRPLARGLLALGGTLAGANLGMMLVASVRRRAG